MWGNGGYFYENFGRVVAQLERMFCCVFSSGARSHNQRLGTLGFNGVDGVGEPHAAGPFWAGVAMNQIKLDSLVAKFRNRFNRKDLYGNVAYRDEKTRQYQGYARSLYPNRHLNEIYHREDVALIDQELPEIEGKPVLDIGCGIGRISRHLAGRGAIVQGIDFSPRAIEIARQNSPESNPTFRVCSVRELDAEHAFDVVIIFGVLCVACKN